METTAPDLARCCLTCHATAADDGSSLKACGACQKARYCSRACQVKDRKQHRIFCSAITEPVPTGCAGEALENQCCAFLEARFEELLIADVVALKLLENTEFCLTHSVAYCFVPNETWTEGDPVKRRYKLHAGAAVSDDYLTQHLNWFHSPGGVKRGHQPEIEPPPGASGGGTQVVKCRCAFLRLPEVNPPRWKSYEHTVSDHVDTKPSTDAELAMVEREGSMENLARKLLE